MKALMAASIYKLQDTVITSPNYHPANAEELLQTILAAMTLLTYKDPDVAKKAHDFILQTTHNDGEQIQFFEEFCSQLLSLDKILLCSTYKNYLGTFIEYKIYFTNQDECKGILHRHACFTFNEEHCYLVSQKSPSIRLIGDPILHKSGRHVPKNPTPEQHQELEQQITFAKQLLIENSGAGIAANQCAGIANPYCLAIV